MHDSLDSAVLIGSPSLRAMSAIDRSMIVVESGSSTASAGRPNIPPAAPVSATAILCPQSMESRRRSSIEAMANESAASSDLRAAVEIAAVAPAGSAPMLISIGLPSAPASRAARLGCSRRFFA